MITFSRCGVMIVQVHQLLSMNELGKANREAAKLLVRSQGFRDFVNLEVSKVRSTSNCCKRILQLPVELNNGLKIKLNNSSGPRAVYLLVILPLGGLFYYAYQQVQERKTPRRGLGAYRRHWFTGSGQLIGSKQSIIINHSRVMKRFDPPAYSSAV